METIIISLGGSVIVPNQIDIKFLKAFRKLILKQRNKKFIIICGGGKIARAYQKAASKLVKLSSEDADWIGIHATRMNAHLLRTVFRKVAHKKVVRDWKKKITFKEKVLIAAGWKPGCSTDFGAVMIAKNLGIKKIVNVSNIDYVYSKDPNKFKDAKPIKQLSWKNFRKLVGNKWHPGLNAPFDPVASRKAQKIKAEVFIVGKSIKNLERVFACKEFEGTVIS